MSASKVPTELIAAYMGTEYYACTPEGKVVLRIGEPSDAMAQLIRAAGAKGAAFITAENPFSERLFVYDTRAVSDVIQEIAEEAAGKQDDA